VFVIVKQFSLMHIGKDSSDVSNVIAGSRLKRIDVYVASLYYVHDQGRRSIMKYEDLLKSHLVHVDNWLQDTIRNNVGEIDERIRDTLEKIVVQTKVMMAEFNVTEDDVRRFVGNNTCLVCNKKFELEGTQITHELEHIDSVFSGDKLGTFDTMKAIVMWIQLYNDTMQIIRETDNVVRRSQDVLNVNYNYMNELVSTIMCSTDDELS